MTDPYQWLAGTREEITARWVVSYQAGAVRVILKQIGRNDVLARRRAIADNATCDIKLSLLVEEFGFPVWLVPRQVKHLSNLVTELLARPTRTSVFTEYKEICEEIPENIMGCPARGLVFNWPHHGTYMTFHDLQDQPIGGHGWFFHRKADGKRLTLQPLQALVTGLGDPSAWAN